MSKKKILFLFNKFPYPVIGGDKLKVYNTAKILKEHFSLDLLCLDEGPAASRNFSREPFENIFYFSFPGLRFKFNAFKGVISSLPLQAHYYYYKEAEKFIAGHLQNYDLVFCNLLRMAPYVIDKKIPKIIDMADSIALTYQRFSRYAKGMWKLLYLIDADRLTRYELEIIRKFDKVLLVNEKEKDLLVSRGADEKKIEVITNGANEELFLKDAPLEENKEVVFFGRLAAFQNEDAVSYFAKEIWPLIRKERKDLKFVIIGADPTDKILQLKKYENIEVTGYLEDPYPRIQKSMLCVFPMRVATGVQNKILEAMALGKAMVVTSNAIEAIKGQDNRDFVVANNPQDMSRRVLELLGDKELRSRIGANARQFIMSKYTWGNYQAKLLPLIEKILSH